MPSNLESIVTGKVWKIEKAIGDSVAAGESVMILESMKMEIPIESPVAGVLRSLAVAEGESVNEGQVLAVVG
ncbi:acetyl-CoA carboxylase biotin carboxyl carrier protein subunit [Variovorax sp. PAMC 28711]|uniref:acetyl-CoA carboxylase biotin carboxyl carrier protein subunit n=1 Tax=Variovorax sp. PAMC 28711 TaxID=1795631 RepID=UPI00078D8F57|nr:acetyl-CoA carboxylase biotin carboxyl carrier protein subunit [Variovorax sp. PAMC 28711]AMM24143.1 acetyl-CoA carboxylase biotin carboxyl carrier protein subunit [Variovorax sp. PAMC 28711]